MSEQDEAARERFERLVLPHMDAAFGLARWLARDRAKAEDAVQEAFLRAYRFFGTFQGGDPRPWLLSIVRNTTYTLMGREPGAAETCAFDERDHGADAAAVGATVVRFPVDPEAAAIARAEHDAVREALYALPHEFREALVLRELHGCSYREIAQILDAPIGTVMSRLSRGRKLLREALAGAPATGDRARRSR